MIVSVARRLTHSFAMLAVACGLAFAMARGAGDPVAQMLGHGASVADQFALRKTLGLDLPVWEQAWRFMASVAHGDFGISYQFGRPVLSLLAERAPATVELAILAGMLSLATAIPVGLFAATRPNALAARTAMALSSVGISIPTFLIATLAVTFMAGRWRFFPAFGRGEVIDLGCWTTGLLTASGWRSIIMPAATLALFQAATVTKIVRAEAIATLASPHIAAVRLRGLPRSVVVRHVLRSIAVPVATVVAVQFGTVAAYAIVTEAVFQWPGLGSLLIGAVRNADVPILASYVVLAAAFFAALNFAVDAFQWLIDPRVRDRQGAIA